MKIETCNNTRMAICAICACILVSVILPSIFDCIARITEAQCKAEAELKIAGVQAGVYPEKENK